jgi:arylsulfatase A-like enzyme
LARALRDSGYATWHVGKWHLGGKPFYPQHHGFDVNIGGCSLGSPHKGYFSPWYIETLEDGTPGEYLDDRLTDEAIELIKSNTDKPFFLNMWFYLVHNPQQAKKSYVEKYRQKAHKLGLDKVEALEGGEFFPCNHKSDKRVMRRRLQSNPTYAAMVETMDENIGRLLKAVEEVGRADNTIVIFTSDNGGLATSEGSPTCNAPLAEGKGWMYDGGVREPLIVKWPGVTQPGTTCDVPVTSPDYYPTVLNMAGLAERPEQHTDGVSFTGLLQGQKELEREAIFWHYPHYGNQGGTPGSAVRCGYYKLIEFFEDGHLELYNLREDIGEKQNLAADLPKQVKELHTMLVAWREQVNALIPQPNPDFTERTSAGT